MTGADWTEGIVLRYGGFYGPGTSLSAEGGEQIEAIRERKFPVVGDGGGVWSFVHIEDAAEATAGRGRRAAAAGIYNIVDDDPAPVAEWLPAAASAVGAPPPRHVPRWLGRIAGRRGRGGHDDRGARSVEREGEARARLAAAAPELARGLRRGGRVSERRTTSCSRSCAPPPSRSPTGCSAASRRRRTWSRRRCCGSTTRSSAASGSSRRARTSRRSPPGSRSTCCAPRGCAARATWASGCPSRS